MVTRFSPSTGNFYPLDIEYPALPDDLCGVTQDAYLTAVNRPANKAFSIVDGQAHIFDAPEAPYQPQADAYLAALRVNRERTLNRITGIAVATDDDKVRAACRVARQNLLDLTRTPAVLAATTMDDLRAAVEAAYSHVVESVPVELRSAFD